MCARLPLLLPAASGSGGAALPAAASASDTAHTAPRPRRSHPLPPPPPRCLTPPPPPHATPHIAAPPLRQSHQTWHGDAPVATAAIVPESSLPPSPAHPLAVVPAPIPLLPSRYCLQS